MLTRFLYAKCWLSFLLGWLAGCTTKLPSDAYRAWVADPTHGLLQTHENNGVKTTAAYRPVELLVLQELGPAAGQAPASLRDSLVRRYASQTHCVLSFSRNNAEIENRFITNTALYEQALNYLNTGIAADVVLVTPQDSVTASSSMYLRQFGSTGKSTVLLVFNTPQSALTKGFQLVFHGEKLGIDNQRFSFAAADLRAIPTLHY